MTKLTKKDRFATLIDVLNGSTPVADLDANDYVDFFKKEIAALDKKAAKAKETAAKKKAEGDELTDRIADVLTGELQTIADIVAALDDEDVSSAKASYRLNKLVKDGKAVKEEVVIKNGDKTRKVVAFKLV